MPGDSGHGLVLVAVGGYGRSELSAASDVDLVLLHDGRRDPAEVATVAEALWYPLWDAGVPIDHAVRSVDEMLDAAVDDLRVASGMLDVRPVAGDHALALTTRSLFLAEWRRRARVLVPELRRSVDQRVAQSGWLAHSAVPDLKESGGGLRDGVVLRALVATWLVDVPHVQAEQLRRELLDVRDVLHEVTGRRTARFSMEDVAAVAEVLGEPPAALELRVRDLGRRMAHLLSTAWRRADDVLVRAPGSARRARLVEVSRGVGVLDGEVVLRRGADPADDPELGLRAALAAARERLPLSSSAAGRIADRGAAPSEPWPSSARDLMVGLLASGPGLVDVWQELDVAGVIDQWLPEWAEIRLRGSSSPVHTWTIDRHSLEATVNAAGLARTVRRPDLLVVAAVLHDIGKGLEGDHSVVGAPVARRIALRWGFAAEDADLVALLVLHHLTLPTIATRRDIEDPATAANVAEVVGDAETLAMLSALTESDARATGESAWSRWRAGLVRGLVDKVHAHLGGEGARPEGYEGWEMPQVELAEGEVRIDVDEHHAGSLVTVTAYDRVALMADIAAALALAGLEIRSARVGGEVPVTTTLWEVASDHVDAQRVRMRLDRVVDGDETARAQLRRRLAYAPSGDTPADVRVRGDVSPTATVIEVRAESARGLLWTCCRAIADAGCSIRSAHVTTFGPEARDVFYVSRPDGSPLDAAEAERVRAGLVAALSGAALSDADRPPTGR